MLRGVRRLGQSGATSELPHSAQPRRLRICEQRVFLAWHGAAFATTVFVLPQ